MNHRTKNVSKNVFSFRFYSTKLVCQLKKKYLHKRNDVKISKRSATSSDVALRAERNFKRYQFPKWLDEYTQIRGSRINVLRTLTLQDDWDNESGKSDTEDGNTQANVFSKKSQMYGKKCANTKVSEEDLTCEFELEVMMGLKS